MKHSCQGKIHAYCQCDGIDAALGKYELVRWQEKLIPSMGQGTSHEDGNNLAMIRGGRALNSRHKNNTCDSPGMTQTSKRNLEGLMCVSEKV